MVLFDRAGTNVRRFDYFEALITSKLIELSNPLRNIRTFDV